MEGFVYILRNPSMPGVVKIGKTRRLPETRLRELFTTGVPTPFEIVTAIYTDDASTLEVSVHSELKDFLVHGSREFFKIDEKEAVRTVLSGFLCDFCLEIAEDEMVVDEGDIYKYAAKCGEHPFIIPYIIREISWDAWKDARNKYKAKQTSAN